MELPAGLPISEEDWEHTLPSVRSVVIMLWQENQVLKQQVFALQKQVKELQLEVERLRERTGKNSTNSSKPPSTDGPQKRSYPKRESSGRKRGGQRGHTGSGRKLKPPEEVNHTIVCKPTNCQKCGADLVGEDARPVRHQVSELPRMKSEVTEYQLHSLTCQACGCETRGSGPRICPRAVLVRGCRL